MNNNFFQDPRTNKMATVFSWVLLVFIITFPHISKKLEWSRDLYGVIPSELVLHYLIMSLLLASTVLVYVECCRSYNAQWTLEKSWLRHVRKPLVEGLKYPEREVLSLLKSIGTYTTLDLLLFVSSITIPFLHFTFSVKTFNLQVDRNSLSIYFLFFGIFDIWMFGKAVRIYRLTGNQNVVLLLVLSILLVYYEILCVTTIGFDEIFRSMPVICLVGGILLYALASVRPTHVSRDSSLVFVLQLNTIQMFSQMLGTHSPMLIVAFLFVTIAVMAMEIFIECDYIFSSGDIKGLWPLLVVLACNLYIYIICHIGEFLEIIFAIFGVG